MKKVLSLFFVFVLIITLSACSTEDLYDLYSDFFAGIEEILPEVTTVTEVKNEYYYVREPQFSVCYNKLNNNQKEFYNRIYSISREMPEGYVVLGEYYEKVFVDVRIAYHAFLSDNAEVFWMPSTYILATVKQNEKRQLAIAFALYDSKNQNKYNVSKEQRNKYQKKFDKIINNIINQAKNLKGEYAKELFFNDYLCANVTYTEKGKFVDSAFGAIALKSALCEGYSRAFKLLCNKVGIECDLVVGTSDGEGHMWNRVNIGKKHSYVDVTWNDNVEYKNHIYFNVTEEQLSKTHTFDPVIDDLSEDEIMKNTSFNFTKYDCSYTGNTYYEKMGQVLWLDYETTAANAINKAANKGKKYVEFLFATEKVLNLFKDDPEKFLTQIQYKLTGVTISSYIQERDVILVFFD